VPSRPAWPHLPSATVAQQTVRARVCVACQLASACSAPTFSVYQGCPVLARSRGQAPRPLCLLCMLCLAGCRLRAHTPQRLPPAVNDPVSLPSQLLTPSWPGLRARACAPCKPCTVHLPCFKSPGLTASQHNRLADVRLVAAYQEEAHKASSTSQGAEELRKRPKEPKLACERTQEPRPSGILQTCWLAGERGQ